MNEELLVLQTRVNGVIYNPFINLKDQTKELKKLLSNSDKFSGEILKLEAALLELDTFESMSYGNIERIKGFNKTKSHILRVIKDILNAQ